MGSLDHYSKTVDWLLEADNPPVRYLTLTNLLGKSEEDREVSDARSGLSRYVVTRQILDRVKEFGTDTKSYHKYTGAYWQVIFLGQFLADGTDPRLSPLLDQLLQERRWISKEGGQCLTANMLAAFTRLGLGEHPTVTAEREALARRIASGKGIECTAVDYSPLPRCYMAQPKLLQCFSQIPKTRRSPGIEEALEILVKSLLEHEVFVYVPELRKEWEAILERRPKRGELPAGETIKGWVARQREEFARDGGLKRRKAKQGWARFGFPLHYNSDVLEATYSLALLNMPWDSRLGPAINVIQEKRTSNGRWILESSLNGKMLADVEVKGKPSKWLTYFALYTLDHFLGQGRKEYRRGTLGKT